MNLKTHTGYPEIQITDTFDWVAKIISGNGKVLDEFTGTANSRSDASNKAVSKIESVQNKYIRPTEKGES